MGKAIMGIQFYKSQLNSVFKNNQQTVMIKGYWPFGKNKN